MLEKDIRLLEELVAIDTDSSKSSNYEQMASLLKKKIMDMGGKVDVLRAKAPDGRPRPNVIGRIDNGGDKTIALNAHYDVVPVDRKGWKSDPFVLRKVGNKLYGRGASDDKSGIVISLIAAEAAKSNANIEFVFTCDEEIGSEYGLQWVLEKKRGKILADYAVVLDVENCIVIGCSGVCNGTIRVKGVEHHAGMPFLGDNAIEKSLGFLQKLKRFDAIIGKYRANGSGEKGRVVNGRFNITMINGGVSPNLIPGSVEAQFDLRSPPGTKVLDLRNMLKQYFEKVRKDEKIGATIEFGHIHENYVTDPKSEIVKLMKRVTKDTMTHVSFGGLDGSFFSEAHIPVVAYGAENFTNHQSDEYVEINTLRKVELEIKGLLESF